MHAVFFLLWWRNSKRESPPNGMSISKAVLVLTMAGFNTKTLCFGVSKPTYFFTNSDFGLVSRFYEVLVLTPALVNTKWASDTDIAFGVDSLRLFSHYAQNRCIDPSPRFWCWTRPGSTPKCSDSDVKRRPNQNNLSDGKNVFKPKIMPWIINRCPNQNNLSDRKNMSKPKIMPWMINRCPNQNILAGKF